MTPWGPKRGRELYVPLKERGKGARESLAI